MRYSIVNPRTPRPDPVARALRDVIQTGSDRASERLRAAEKVASARRATLRDVKAVRRTLMGVAPCGNAWEQFVQQMGDFRK